jgi:hypothetical protein
LTRLRGALAQRQRVLAVRVEDRPHLFALRIGQLQPSERQPCKRPHETAWSAPAHSPALVASGPLIPHRLTLAARPGLILGRYEAAGHSHYQQGGRAA